MWYSRYLVNGTYSTYGNYGMAWNGVWYGVRQLINSLSTMMYLIIVNMVLHGVAWCGVVWRVVACCGVARCGAVWSGVVWHGGVIK